MPTGSAARGIRCRDCDESHDLDLTRYPCPACGGILDVEYDLGAIGVDRATLSGRSGSMWRYRELLPIRDESAIVSLGEGATPLVECPTLAERMGVARVVIKDEGQNPTNTFKDRGLSAAISAAVERSVPAVALPSAGNAGQSASAYAARAGLPCHVFLNHQAGDIQKALTRAHGADLRLEHGKIDEAGAAFGTAVDREGWYSVATFQTPFRHEGKKTMGYELFEDLGWTTPDEIVYPTGGGVGLIGMAKAYDELAALGWVSGESPRMTVAQSTGSAPIVDAIEAGATEHARWTSPDTIAKGVEIPDPGASPWILEVVSRTDGAGVAVSDEAAIEAAIEAARSDGIEMSVTSAIALAGALERADAGAYDPDETIAVINTGAGCKTASALGMGTGTSEA